MTATFFDTHTHLNDAQFEADRQEVLEASSKAGVTRIVEIADSPDDWDRAVALARARPKAVRASLGLHPYYADRWTPDLAERFAKKALLPEVVALGEIGLDYVKTQISPEVQKKAFVDLLGAAYSARVAAVVHCRGAYGDLLPLLINFYAGKTKTRRFWGVLHCFSGTLEEAVEGVRLGFALGVDGPVTYPKNDALRAALKAAGLEALVLETDSPYLPPQSSRGKRNSPAAIPEIAERVAQVFGVSVEEVARQTTATAESLYQKV